jgi:hypothetical protein
MMYNRLAGPTFLGSRDPTGGHPGAALGQPPPFYDGMNILSVIEFYNRDFGVRWGMNVDERSMNYPSG